MSSQRLRSRGLGVWAGLFVAPAAWYAAHQAGFYVLSVNCAGPPLARSLDPRARAVVCRWFRCRIGPC
jgi:hypothetical protein